MAEGEGITAMEEGSARGEFRGGILHNFIVTLFTPKCNLCNLDYNLGAKPLNSLNLDAIMLFSLLRRVGKYSIVL